MIRLVLIGAGHVHMGLLQCAQRLRDAGIHMTLVDTGSFACGAGSMRYLRDPDLLSRSRCLLRAVSAQVGAAHVEDRAIGVDTRHRRVWLASGQRLDYDLLSFNVGQVMDSPGLDDGANRLQIWRATAVREIAQLGLALKPDEPRARRSLNIAVAGATIAAARVVSALSAPVGDTRTDHRISWYVPEARLLSDAPAGAARRLSATLARRGVQIMFSTPIASLDDRAVVSRDGRRFGADHVVLAERPRAPRIIHAGSLPATDAGIYVTGRLQSPTDDRIFAVGSCAQRVGGTGLPAQDVKRQRDVLAHNLIATARRRPLRRYRASSLGPVIELQDGSAIGWLGHVWWHNRLAARLADRHAIEIRKTLGVA